MRTTTQKTLLHLATGTGIALLLIIIVLGGAIVLMHARYDGRVLPGVSVGDVAVGGDTIAAGTTRLSRVIDALERDGLPFVYGSKSVSIRPVVFSPEDPDVFHELIRWDVDATMAAAYAVGRRGTLWQRAQETLLIPFLRHTIVAEHSLAPDVIERAVTLNFSEFIVPARDATVSFTEEGGIRIVPEEPGRHFDTDALIHAVTARARALGDDPVVLTRITTYPTVTARDLEPFASEAAAWLMREPFTLTHDNAFFLLTKNDWGAWITVTKNNESLTLDLDAVRAEPFFAPMVAAIDRPAQNARFAMDGGKVVEFAPATAGRAVDSAATLDRITAALRAGTGEPIALAVTTTEPSITTANANNLGIVELLGTGNSNFAGSPANRRHNIRVGAAALNGTLIPPGEEFSVVKTLGPITGEAGYLPELVIKGNETIPEYGGGLCQVSTTAFRVAMAAGAPITERRNHAYVVSYYHENGLPGTDATIYPQHPDFRFTNDTPGHLLLLTRMEGDDLVYELWGTPDGRSAARTTPVISNRRAPPPTRIIETTDLAPGERRCTERAHDGVTAEFTYTVNYADGETNEQVFRSTYRPWQAVCMVGVQEANSE